MLQMMCTDGTPLQSVCLSLVMATVGTDYTQLNTVGNLNLLLRINH